MNTRTRKLVYTALFAALTAVGAFLRIPMGYSSVTLQYLFTAMVGLLLSRAAWVVGAVAGESLDPKRMALASLAGLAALYAVGMPYMALILNAYMGKGMMFSALLWAGMLPYLPGDAVKIIVAAGVCPVLRRRLRLADGSDKRGE